MGDITVGTGLRSNAELRVQLQQDPLYGAGAGAASVLYVLVTNRIFYEERLEAREPHNSNGFESEASLDHYSGAGARWLYLLQNEAKS